MSVNPETINSHMTQRSAGGRLRPEVHARIEKIIEGVIQARAPRAYGFRVLVRTLDPFLKRSWTTLAHIGVVSRPSWQNLGAEMFRALSCNSLSPSARQAPESLPEQSVGCLWRAGS